MSATSSYTKQQQPQAPGDEDVLGARISAALVDLAILTAAAVVLSVAIGAASVEDATFLFTLEGPAFGLLLAFAFVYYFTSEALTGRTVGKLLLGIRVVDRDGGRPSAWAVIVRTVLRAVDWLPAFYLTGFVAVVATGARRQRLGDLLGGTRVERGAHLRRRGLAATLVAALVIVAVVGAVVVAAGSGTSSEQVGGGEDSVVTYRAHGVSFDRPADWRQATGGVTDGETGGGDELWAVAFGPGGVDMVEVTAYRLPVPVTAASLDPGETTSLLGGLLEQVDGSIRAGPERITMGDLPGLRYEGKWTAEDGTAMQSTYVFAFDGTTEYFVLCQSGPSGGAAIERGCEQVVRTFEVEDASRGDGAPDEGYSQVTDDQDVIALEVPAGWDDLDGGENPEYGPSIRVASDLGRFFASWDVSGIVVEVSDRHGPDQLETVLQEIGPSGECTSGGRERYDNPPFSGEVERWRGCGGTDTVAVTAAFSPADGSLLIRAFGQAVDEGDLMAIDHALDSIEISTITAERAEQPGPERADQTEAKTGDAALLDLLATLNDDIDRALRDDGSVLTDSMLAEMTSVMRTCSRELAAAGAPRDRFERVHALIERACRQYDRGADCFDTAAGIGVPEAGSADDRNMTEALDCGFDAWNRGGMLLLDAQIEADAVGPSS